MGGTTFVTQSSGKTAKEAFQKAVERAQYSNGHDGYTGTIAEKSSFVMIACKETDPKLIGKFIDNLIESEDKRIDDKWGPAGCIKIEGETDTYVFFGWASC